MKYEMSFYFYGCELAKQNKNNSCTRKFHLDPLWIVVDWNE